MADQSFLGTGWSFPPTWRRETGGVDMVSEEENVRKSIQIILSTRSTGQVTLKNKDGVPELRTISGERVLQPTFGCNLLPYVFEPMNTPTIAMIERMVREALVYNEPRIIVNEGDIISTPDHESGVLLISINYTIIRTNTRYNYVFPFYMNEATNLAK